MGVLNLNPKDTVLELKKEFHKLHKQYYPDRQWFTIGDVKGKALKNNSSTLESYGISKKETLYFKDLGPQISWKLVFIIEYFGPMAIFALLGLFPGLLYGAEGAK